MWFFENEHLFIEVEPSEIPWLKIFTKIPYKEFSEASLEVKVEMWRVLEIVEKEMLHFYHPAKINIASFGNYLPHVHFHIMARFLEDSHFPESMWGKKQRDSALNIPPIDAFIAHLKPLL